MAGYLAVTDEMTLTPQGALVVGKEFLRRSEASPAPARPPYSGTGSRARSWSSPFYNQESKMVSTIRGRITDALYAGGDFHLVMIGDSKTEGSGVQGGESHLYAHPSILRRMLGAVEGILPVYPGGNVWDKRWSGYGFKKSDPDYTRMGIVPDPNATLAYWVQFNSDFDHSGGTFWIHADTEAKITVRVDGGAAQAFTVPAGSGFHAITPTVAGNSAHVYRVDTPDKVHITTFIPTYDGPRLKVSRMGRGGSGAADWAPGFRADGTGLWDSLQTTTADAFTVGLGTNGTQNQANADAVAAIYATTVALGVPMLAIAPGGLGGGVGAARPLLTDYHLMYDALWDAADRHDIPLIDLQSVIGDWPTANAAGLMADNIHENRHGYAYEAAAVANLLA